MRATQDTALFVNDDAAGLDVTSVLIVLCEGNDRATIASNVDIAAVVYGGPSSH